VPGAVVLWAIYACDDLLGPELPDGAVPLVPIPAEYALWWSVAERCSGVRGDFRAVRWYVVPDARTIPGTDEAIGSYIESGRRIVLAKGQERNGFLVRHEMLHALWRRGGHPRRLFLEQCGGIVSCSDRCQLDAGDDPVWDLRAKRVIPETVIIRTEILPSVASLSTGTHGCVTFLAGAQNVLNEPIALGVARGGAFSWNVEGLGGGSGGGPVLQDSLIVIAPGQVWNYAFDCPQLIAAGTSPGEYSVWAGLGHVRSAPVTLTVVP
jgi:hypothetical protein